MVKTSGTHAPFQIEICSPDLTLQHIPFSRRSFTAHRLLQVKEGTFQENPPVVLPHSRRKILMEDHGLASKSQYNTKVPNLDHHPIVIYGVKEDY